MVGRIYKEDYLTLLQIKYISSGPHGFRDFFYVFSYCKSMGANGPRSVGNLDPRGMVGRISVGYH